MSSSRQLKDWAVIAANPGASIVLRVWDADQVLAGLFTVQIPQAAAMLSSCSWSGTGWSDTFFGCEVVTITNGDIFAGPVDNVSVLTAVSGEKLVVGFGLGISGVQQGQSAAQAFGGSSSSAGVSFGQAMIIGSLA